MTFYELYSVLPHNQYISITEVGKKPDKNPYGGFAENSPFKYAFRKVAMVCVGNEDIMEIVLEAEEDGKDERMDKVTQEDMEE